MTVPQTPSHKQDPLYTPTATLLARHADNDHAGAERCPTCGRSAADRAIRAQLEAEVTTLTQENTFLQWRLRIHSDVLYENSCLRAQLKHAGGTAATVQRQMRQIADLHARLRDQESQEGQP